MRRAVAYASAALVVCVGCGGGSKVESFSVPNTAEVATGVVSGAFNKTAGRDVGVSTWSCTGGALTPSYAGPSLGQYTFTPQSCSVTLEDGRTASSVWSGVFLLVYGPSCDDTHPWFGDQVEGCSVTRTTPSGGNTRTDTGPEGNALAITVDSNGAGTGWDASVSPAPTNDGVVATCGAGGCASNGTLAINGSHLTGAVAPEGSTPTEIVDVTVSTPTPLTFTASGAQRVLSGTVTVQHNRAQYTATATFEAVTFGQASCCYPTSGTVTTTFQDPGFNGATETLTFGSVCGEVTLTTRNGRTFQRTLRDCF